MKRKTSKTQLALLSILAGAVYLFIITANFVGGWKSGVKTFKESAQQAEMEIKTGSGRSWENFILTLEPKNFDQFYSDSIRNLKTGEITPISYDKIQVWYTHTQPQTTKSFLLDTGMLLTAIPSMVLYLLILILFYKLVLAFYKDNIFSKDNVRRLKLLGTFTIIIYILQLAFYFMYHATTRSLLELSDYNIIMPDLEHELLLLGVILLIATNVMKRTITLKEEQDLTI